MTHLLFDTNVFLWYFEGSNRINSIKELVASEEVQVFISAVSWWEIIIKTRIGKLDIDYNAIRCFAKNHNFLELPVTGNFADAYLELPYLHRDPFDHMLLAQAITSPMRLITSDAILAEYSSLVMVI
ncbi:MAG: type II toxin-antitoxin system VapC family toxin [Treponema sp.]|jgi:PIN domain nuclease of toxin-antitoxin system|nr:type II toxin-antitoxin system VapC family toxin [Treponema sp.]